ncbi:MAG TPA: sulfite exporter TauE/SafE family protein [Burkholderiales bacterium]|nr:sulfite exporter TauE/SafE family protein [Burkholderiales bacterium]
MIWVVGATALAAGLLVGLTGIGGVLLVPVLTGVAGVPLEHAIAACMPALLLAGLYAAFVHLRRVRLPARPLSALCLAAAAGAALGAATLDRLPDTGVRLFVAALALASGAHALLAPPVAGGRVPGAAPLAFLGLAVGYGSAISGTGGPVMLIPILLALRTPVREAIALGVAAGLPITVAASTVYGAAGRIDIHLALTLAALLIAGTWAGARLSARFSGRALTAAVAWTLVGVGAWFAYASLR